MRSLKITKNIRLRRATQSEKKLLFFWEFSQNLVISRATRFGVKAPRPDKLSWTVAASWVMQWCTRPVFLFWGFRSGSGRGGEITFPDPGGTLYQTINNAIHLLGIPHKKMLYSEDCSQLVFWILILLMWKSVDFFGKYHANHMNFYRISYRNS